MQYAIFTHFPLIPSWESPNPMHYDNLCIITICIMKISTVICNLICIYRVQESELLIDSLFPFAADRITSVSLVTNGEGRQSTPTDSVMNVLLLQGHSFFLFSRRQ